ncbi:MAG: EamA family transporter [Actinobacteria bacterium]|nr:EamA family transporter [Actinomycetota bacterium]
MHEHEFRMPSNRVSTRGLCGDVKRHRSDAKHHLRAERKALSLVSDAVAAQLFALSAATCFAASQVTVKRGIKETSIVSSVLISLTVALGVISISVVFSPPDEIRLDGVVLFALGGLAAPGISRWAATTGIHRLGPSIAVPITQGARPLLAFLGAMAIFGEAPSLQRGLGLLVIVAGGWELSRSREDARSLSLGSLEGPVEEAAPSARFFRPGLFFPLLAAGMYATSDLVIKEAVTRLEHPRFGALVGMSTAVLLWMLGALFIRPIRRELHVGSDVGWLLISGVFSGLALISLFSALDKGDVTLVSPLVAAQPLGVFLFSRILLKKVEDLHLSTVLAGSAIVVGTIIVSL